MMKYWQTRCGTLVEQIISGWSNVYLVSFNGHHIMVDSGPSLLSGKLNESVSSIGLKSLDALVLTHTHFDHTGNAAILKERFRMPVLVHRSESVFLECGFSPLPHGSWPISEFIYNLGARRVEKYLKVKVVIPDILVDDRFDLSVFGIRARLIHTPGHTRGSISMIIDEQLVISGDTCVSPFPGRAFPPWADDPERLVRSWKILLDTNCEVFLPMHHRTIPRKTLEREYEKHRKLSL